MRANDVVGWYRSSHSWRIIGLRYVPALAALNLVWETAHLPLYTLWREASADDIVFAVWHCTLGDVMIGTFALMAALTLMQSGEPSSWRLKVVMSIAVAGSVAYTIFSEWLNVSVRQSWAYSDLMPILPPLETGLSPVLQWILIPPVAMAFAAQRRPRFSFR